MKVESIASCCMGLAVLLGTSQAFGTAVNITTPDYNGPGGAFNTSSPYGWNGGTAGAGREDNEVEQRPNGGGGILKDQRWDLEAFAINGDAGSRHLFMVGGYDFTGLRSYYNSHPSEKNPGDLFIKVGGTEPGYLPTTEPGGNIKNGDYFDWDYAVRFTPGGSGGLTAQVFALDSDTMVTTVLYDNLGSNPWKVADSLTAAYTPAVSYDQQKTAGQVSDIVEGDSAGSLFDGLLDNSAPQGHYVVDLDMSWLSAASGTPVYFSYTMNCGNDHMKGSYDGGFRVPDNGMTLFLLSFGLGIIGLGRRLWVRA